MPSRIPSSNPAPRAHACLGLDCHEFSSAPSHAQACKRLVVAAVARALCAPHRQPLPSSTRRSTLLVCDSPATHYVGLRDCAPGQCDWGCAMQEACPALPLAGFGTRLQRSTAWVSCAETRRHASAAARPLRRLTMGSAAIIHLRRPARDGRDDEAANPAPAAARRQGQQDPSVQISTKDHPSPFTPPPVLAVGEFQGIRELCMELGSVTLKTV